MQWKYNDGGRSNYFKGRTGDCACRAIAIATEKDYFEIYNKIIEYAVHERPRGKSKRSHPRTGVKRSTTNRLLRSLGWNWTPTMQVGSGCKIHLKASELPSGRLICRVSKHWVAVIDGVIHDTFDPSREETRCVYGYWSRPEA